MENTSLRNPKHRVSKQSSWQALGVHKDAGGEHTKCRKQYYTKARNDRIQPEPCETRIHHEEKSKWEPVSNPCSCFLSSCLDQTNL